LVKTKNSRQYQETLTTLNKLYQSSNIADLLDLDEKFVAFMTIKRVFIDACEAKQRIEGSIVHCINILNSLVQSWFDWNLVKAKDFHDILMTLVRIFVQSECRDALQSIKDRTKGVQCKEVTVVLSTISDWSCPPELLSARESEGLDDLTLLLKMETKLLVSTTILIQAEILSRIVGIASNGEELLRTRAMSCLVLAGHKHSDRKEITTSLLKVLMHGNKDIRDIAISTIDRCTAEGRVRLASLDFVRKNAKNLIIAILHSVRDNSHGNGQKISVHCSRVLNSIIQGLQATMHYLDLSDILGICTALFDNPHVSVSSLMCSTLLEYLASTVPNFEEIQLDAVSTLARYNLDRGCKDPEVSLKIVRYYLQLTRARNDALTDLARVPHLLDSIVCIAHNSRENLILNDACLELIVQFAKSPLNWKRLACTSGVIPILIQHVQSSETNHPHDALSPLPGRDVFKACIQNLAAAI
jgi:hypothetical protein